jgi:carboxypeptidase C (cathepsin A)
MRRLRFGVLLPLLGLTLSMSMAAEPDARKFEPFKPESVATTGSVTIGGQAISYQAIAGTLVVHPKDWDDVPREPNPEKVPSTSTDEGGDAKNPTAQASMFYVAYFKTGAVSRPVTFVYNGGPGSATLWLHMGAFGPRRIVTATDAHTAAAPYALVNNASSLLDVTDLVFIDAPGTGFSRIAGKDKEKAFFGVDQDAYAFAEFITQFLSKYGRWNSPKYLFGESYGTPRSAVLINQLEAERSIDFNGVILLSQILNFDLSPDRPTANPGVDLPYQTVLPTYAATNCPGTTRIWRRCSTRWNGLPPVITPARSPRVPGSVPSTGPLLPPSCMTTRDCRSTTS